MARLTTRELEEALQELLIQEFILENGLNWVDKKNSELTVGDKIVTKFDRKSGLAMAGVTITSVDHHPRGCTGHVHVKTNHASIGGGCYDHVARTRVFA